jgi:hypothetical protein
VHSAHGISVEYIPAYLMHHSHVGTDDLFTASNRFKYSPLQKYHTENNSLRCNFGTEIYK